MDFDDKLSWLRRRREAPGASARWLTWGAASRLWRPLYPTFIIYRA
jgi:hypothetical protein